MCFQTLMVEIQQIDRVQRISLSAMSGLSGFQRKKRERKTGKKPAASAILLIGSLTGEIQSVVLGKIQIENRRKFH